MGLLAGSYLAFTPVKYEVLENIWDKLLHSAGFLALAFAADFSFPDRGFGMTKIAPLVAYGMFIEVVQHFLPYRSFELVDVVADAAGLLIYAAVLPGIRRLPLLRNR